MCDRSGLRPSHRPRSRVVLRAAVYQRARGNPSLGGPSARGRRGDGAGGRRARERAARPLRATIRPCDTTAPSSVPPAKPRASSCRSPTAAPTTPATSAARTWTSRSACGRSPRSSEDVTGLPAAVKRRVTRVFLADGDALALSPAQAPRGPRAAARRVPPPGARQLLRQRAEPAGEDGGRAARPTRSRPGPHLPGARVGRRRDARRHPQGHDRGRADRGLPAGLRGRHCGSPSRPSWASPARRGRRSTPAPRARPCRPSTPSTSASSR